MLLLQIVGAISQRQRVLLRDETMEMTEHAMNNYMRHAYPHDELKPLTCEPRITKDRGTLDDPLGGYMLTLVDGLDTLAVMGRDISPLLSNIYLDDFDEALAAVRDVGPGGHYLGHKHTREKFQSAFFMPEMFDNNSVEQWIAEGSQEITARALTRAKELLAAYEEPKLDAAVDEQLRDYIARRERQIPAVDALNDEY